MSRLVGMLERHDLQAVAWVHREVATYVVDVNRIRLVVVALELRPNERQRLHLQKNGIHNRVFQHFGLYYYSSMYAKTSELYGEKHTEKYTEIIVFGRHADS